jgi:hypothetical protein
MAVTIAVAYLLCVLAPPVALAFMDSTSAYHCLTTRHQHGAAAQVNDARTHISHAAAHEHGGRSAHDHDFHHDHGQKTADTEGVAVNCCGYFCLSAMPASPVPDCVPTIRIVPVAIAIEDRIAGRGPDRIERPPNVRLPL